MASDPDFQEVVTRGKSLTSPARDYTVKVDVGGLASGQTYFYRFHALDGTSVTGRTRTAPKNSEEIRLGVVSCSNYEFGYFNSYGRLALEDLHAVLHLGDYIYEYGPGTYGDSTLDRRHLPGREILTLQDYRTRYSQYRLDPDLQAAHARHPFITVWDDHEITNNSYKDGAQNHQPEEGDYGIRRDIARQVYYEWLPVRENPKLYRKFSFGNLVDLFMLDERLEGRDAQLDSLNHPDLMDSARTMLGQEQYQWFVEQLRSSDALWKVVGNQVIYSYLNWGHESFNINLDAWDGYPVEQQKIATVIQKDSIENVVFVTGDTHSSWAFEVTHDPFYSYDRKTGEGAIAVEFGTTSINSGNSNERFPTEEVLAHEVKIVNSDINPHLKYANLRDHGFMVVTFRKDSTKAEWYYMETLSSPSHAVKEKREASVAAGSTRLKLR
jgi:alkaline phosphatase D